MASRPTIRTDASRSGIIVTVTADRASSGLNEIARHRPTRYALMMRRERANASRRARRVALLPAVLPGDCGSCAGLGVVNQDRARCPVCHGSGMR